MHSRPGLAQLVVPFLCILAVSRANAQCSANLPRWTDGLAGCRGSLVRDAAEAASDSMARPGIVPLRLLVETSWNSRLPFSWNDGGRWAGRGWSNTTSFGFQAMANHVSLIVAPEVISVQNLRFPVLPSPQSGGKNPYANPWHAGARSIDQPSRFGSRGYVMVDPGASTLELSATHVAAGASTAAMWWGPGIRNALVMSTNAGGVPHVFVRTPRPLVTRWGSAEARVVLGVLTESRFFNADPSDDWRSLSAGVVTVRPAFDSGLTMGATRAVVARLGGRADAFAHGGDLFMPITAGTRDGLQSLFARWEQPETGFEIHAEWARLRFPSTRQLLVSPQGGQGYTLGGQWLSSASHTTRVGFRAEATMLEQDTPPSRAEPPGFYTSSNVPQGYTQRGQVIGAAVGPGGSTQWAQVYMQRQSSSLGMVLGRIRTDDDAYSRQPTGRSHRAHDITGFIGLRGSAEWRGLSISGEALRGRRLNYLFQAVSLYTWDPTFDVSNTTLNISVTRR